MYRETNISNSDYTMETGKIFENIIQQVKSSNLNFRLEESPFSAVINLKKSIINDKLGNTLSPPPLQLELGEKKCLIEKTWQLEKCVESLKYDLEKAVDDCAEVYKYKVKLESDLENKSNEMEKLIIQNKKLRGETKVLESEKISLKTSWRSTSLKAKNQKLLKKIKKWKKFTI